MGRIWRMKNYIYSLNEMLDYERYDKIRFGIGDLIDFMMEAEPKDKDTIIRFLIFYKSRLKETSKELKRELKELEDNPEFKNTPEDIKKRLIIRDLKNDIEYIKNAIQNYRFTRELPEKEYNYIYNIVNNIRDTDYFREVIKKYPAMLNSKDNDGHSLLYNMAMNYLNSYDPYYLSIICMMLEDKNIIVDSFEVQDLYEIISNFMNQKYSNMQALKRIKFIMNHYFEGDKMLQNRVNTIHEDKSSTDLNLNDNLEDADYRNREDFRNVGTFKIAGKDECYSFVDDNDKSILYVHVPDLSYYIKKDTKEDKRASSVMLGSLFDSDFIKKYVSFKDDDSPKMAITFKIVLDKRGRYIDGDVFESVISNNKTVAENDEIVANIKDLVGADGTLKDSLDGFIARFVHDNNIPLVYETEVEKDELKRHNMYSGVTKFTNKYFKKEKNLAIDLLKIYKLKDNSKSSSYTYEYSEGGKVVTDASRNYIALENLRMIKRYLTDRKYDRDKSDIKDELVIANALKK